VRENLAGMSFLPQDSDEANWLRHRVRVIENEGDSVGSV
jgi:hypothetical protein